MRRVIQYSIIFSFAITFLLCLFESFGLGRTSWGMTEWLINYEGGFIRRGLFGQWMYDLWKISGIKPNIQAIIVSVSVFCFVAYWFFKKTIGKIPVYVMCSSLLLGLPLYEHFLIRKDVLFIALVILCLAVMRSKIKMAYRDLLINVIGMFAVLVHEMFFFLCFPALVSMRTAITGQLLPSIARYSGIIICFVLAVLFHGNIESATAINKSLVEVWYSINPSDILIAKPDGAIDALSWSTRRGLSLSLSLYNDFSWGIYIPLAWALTICISFMYVVYYIGRGIVGEEKKIANILLFQLLSISPLFLLGWDYGRWIYLWSCSSLAIYLSGINTGPLFSLIPERTTSILTKRLWEPKCWHLLVIGIPGACWGVWGYICSVPYGDVLVWIARLFKYYIDKT